MMKWIEVEHYGAVGDGVTDDTAAINAAVADCAGKCELMFTTGKIYMVDAEVTPQLFDSPTAGGIMLKSGSRINLNGATIRAIPNAVPKYAVFLVTDGAEDVSIYGGRVEGERDLHTYGTNQNYPTDEFGYGVQILNASKVRISDVDFYGFTGDGVFTAADSLGNEPEDVVIESCTFDYCRRQGVSITRGGNVKVINNTITNIGGTAPGSGVDVESGASSKPKSVIIGGNTISSTDGYSIINYDGVDVSITDNICDNGISCGYGDGTIVSDNIIDFIPQPTGYQFGVASLPGSKNLCITGNVIKNASAGLSVSGDKISASRNVISDSRDYGVYLTSDAHGVSVSNNRITDTGIAAVYSLDEDAVIRGNDIASSVTGVHSASGEIAGNSIKSCDTGIRTSGDMALIIGNRLDQCGTSKVIHSESTESIINDNTITANQGSYCIYTKKAKVAGNVIDGCSGYAAIYLVDAGNSVTDNTVDSSSCTNGVLTSAASTNNIISANNLINLTNSLFVTTPSNIITNNVKSGGIYNIAAGQTVNANNN